MRPYLPDLHPHPARVLLLFAGALLLGAGLGALAYFISGFIYLIIIYPVFVSLAGLLIYLRLVTFARVSTPLLVRAACLLFGLATVTAYFFTPYYQWRAREIRLVAQEYQVIPAEAAYAVDSYVHEEGGLPGMFGFLSLRARAGESFSNYLMVNAAVMKLFDFTLKDTAAWLYWLVEAGLLIAPLGFVFFKRVEPPFNRSANAFYNITKQIGVAAPDSLPELLASLNRGDVSAAAAFIHPEDTMDHPLLEIYASYTKGKPGKDRLLTLKSTRRVSAREVKRQEIGQWELSQTEYEALLP